MRQFPWAVLLLCAACGGEGTPADAGANDRGTSAPDGGLVLDASSDADAEFADDSGNGDAGVGADLGPSDTGWDAGVSGCWAPGAGAVEQYRGLLGCLRGPKTSAEKRGAIAELITALEAGEGLPIVTSSQAIFLYVRDPAYDPEDDGLVAEDYDPDRRVAPIRVAGDFNAWAPDGLALREEAEGFFHGAFPLDVATSERWRYKLVSKNLQGDDVWFSDPLSRRYDYDPNGRISIVRGGLAGGHLERLGPLSGAGISPRIIELWLPPGYDPGAMRYPVLYLHDGNNLYSRFQVRSAPVSWEADQVFQAEIEGGRVAPFLAVGVPNSSARFDEYTQTTDTRTGTEVGGRAVDYAAFLLDVVKPAVDARYRTLAGQADTAVLGSSLGGLVSYYLGLHHPDVFGCVAGMSSSFWWGDSLGNPTMLDDYTADTTLGTHGQRYYLDSGGGPGNGCPDDGADNYCATIAMRDLLVSRGIDTFPDDPDAVPLTPSGVDIYHWWTADAPHNESSWHERLFRPLRLCFPAP